MATTSDKERTFEELMSALETEDERLCLTELSDLITPAICCLVRHQGALTAEFAGRVVLAKQSSDKPDDPQLAQALQKLSDADVMRLADERNGIHILNYIRWRQADVAAAIVAMQAEFGLEAGTNSSAPALSWGAGVKHDMNHFLAYFKVSLEELEFMDWAMSVHSVFAGVFSNSAAFFILNDHWALGLGWIVGHLGIFTYHFVMMQKRRRKLAAKLTQLIQNH
eukprot:m51a1_g3869 hypothetical protein (224) ;mRNA; f:430891-431992